MDSNSLKKANKWYVTLLSLIGIAAALFQAALFGLTLSIVALVVAKATKSSESVPLIAVLVSGLALMAFFFIS